MVCATEKIICLGVGTVNYCQCARALQKWLVLVLELPVEYEWSSRLQIVLRSGNFIKRIYFLD